MAGMPWLLHGFSTRHGGVSTVYGGSGKAGDLNLGFTEADDRANVERNRRLFLQAVTGDPHFPLITVRQVHSPTIRVVTAGEAGTRTNLEEADGLMTTEPGTLLGIQTADCIPRMSYLILFGVPLSDPEVMSLFLYLFVMNLNTTA